MHHRPSTRHALVSITLAAIAWGTGGPTGALLTQHGLTPLAVSFWRLASAAAWLTIARLLTHRTSNPAPSRRGPAASRRDPAISRRDLAASRLGPAGSRRGPAASRRGLALLRRGRAVLRRGLASSGAGPAALRRRPAALRRAPISLLLAAGPLRHVLSGLGLAVCQLGYFTAIPRVGVGLATVIALGAAPILITVVAREHLTPALVAAVAGLALLSATGGSASLTGIAAAVLSAAGYSLTTLLNRNTPDPLTAALLGFVAGALFLAPFAALPTTLTGWLLIAYFGLIPTAVAYTLFYTGLRTLKASTAAAIALLEPVVAAAIGILAFHERLSAPALLGGLILLLAVAAQSRS